MQQLFELYIKENSAPNRRIFLKFDTWDSFWKFAEKIQGSLPYDKNNV